MMTAFSARRSSSWIGRSCSAVLATVLLTVAGCATGPYELGRRALDQGDPQAAEHYFDQALQAGDRVFEAQRERGAAKLAGGDPTGALADLLPLQGQQPDDVRLLWLLGQAHSQVSDHASAAEAYARYEQLTRDPRARKAAEVRVAQLRHTITVEAASDLLEERRTGRAPDPNSVAVVAFLPPPDREDPVDAIQAERDANIRRALVAFVSADLAKVDRVRVVADDMMDVIREELAVSYDNRRYFEDGSLVPQGSEEPARHLVYGYFESMVEAARMGAVKHADATTAPVSEVDGAFAQLMDMESALVVDVLEAMGVSPTPEERVAIGVKPTRNLDAFLAFGEGLRHRDAGRMEEAAAAFARASRLDSGFTMAQQQGTMTQAMAAGPEPVMVPPPVVADHAAAAATQAAASLGFGLAPDTSAESSSSSTSDMTTVRGTSTLSVSGRTSGGQ